MTKNKKRKSNSPLNNSDSRIHCVKCSETISKSEKTINCATCDKIYHIECVRITRTQFKKISNDNWYCNNMCKKNQTVINSMQNESEDGVSDDDDKASDAPIEIPQFADLVQSQQYIAGQLDQILKEQKLTREMLLNYKKMEKRVVELEFEVDLLKQQRNDNFMLVTGIPTLPNENLAKIYSDISSKLNVTTTERDVMEITRLKSRPNSNSAQQIYPPSILIQFSHPTYKTRFMAAKKTFGSLYTNQILPSSADNQQQINFRFFLTPANAQLLKYARTLKNHGYEYIWFDNNKVLAKKPNSTATIHIKSKAEVDSIIKQKK